VPLRTSNVRGRARLAAFVGGCLLVAVHQTGLSPTAKLRSTGICGRLTLVGASAEAPPSSSSDSCKEAVEVGYEVFEAALQSWQASSRNKEVVKNLGKVIERKEQAALVSFDSVASDKQECAQHREALVARLHKEAMQVVAQQLLVAESVIAGNLQETLYQLMEQQNHPVRIQEKLEVLQHAIAEYRKMAKMLSPSWAPMASKEQQLNVERRLGEISTDIERSAEGQRIQMLWEDRRTQRAMNDQGKLSVDVKPSLHVMLRPEGLGALQIYSSGPVGPPYNPATMHIGILNDGSIADVYREHPTPPLVRVQPNFDLDMKLR